MNKFIYQGIKGIYNQDGICYRYVHKTYKQLSLVDIKSKIPHRPHRKYFGCVSVEGKVQKLDF